MSTRVVVTGANGQVGVDLVDALLGRTIHGGDPSFQPDGRPVREGEFDVVAANRNDLDVTDDHQVMKFLRASRPQVVVNLAAYTAVERAEEERERCYLVNGTATGSLSRAAASVGAHLVTVSTDYVFNGQKGDAYVEDDLADPLNVYGASKWAGEQLCSPDDTVVRTSWVMGVRGTSVVHLIAERARSGGVVRFVNDQRGTVSAASDLARCLVTLARERPGGCWHIANSGDTTWFDVATYVGQLLGRGDDFATAVSTGELVPPPLAQRPQRSDLNTSKFAQSFSPLGPWRDAVARLINERYR